MACIRRGCWKYTQDETVAFISVKRLIYEAGEGDRLKLGMEVDAVTESLSASSGSPYSTQRTPR